MQNFNIISKYLKIGIFLLILLLMIISVERQISTNKSLKINQKNTIVFWTLQLGSFDKYIYKIIKEYECQNRKIKIKWVDVPYSEGEKRILASILTDNPPDLVNLTPDFSLLLAQKKALYLIEENDLKQFLPSLSNMLKYNDKYFGIPFYATSAVTLNNLSICTDTPKTYDDLFKLSIKNGYYLTMINFAENDTLLKLLNKYNINNPQNINTDKSIKLFEKFKFLYDKNLIPKESVTQTHRDALEKYMSGQLAYLVTGANFINMIKENAPNIYKNTKLLPQLTGDTGLYDYSLMNFVIPLKSKNHKDSLDFALFFTNKMNQLEFAKLTQVLPVNQEALNDEYFTKNKDNDLQSQARIISAKQLKYLQPPITNIKNKKELNILSGNYIQQILINNSPINETLDKFSADWKKLDN